MRGLIPPLGPLLAAVLAVGPVSRARAGAPEAAAPAATARLSGTVRGKPRVQAKQNGEAYRGSSAVLFDYGRLEKVVVYAEPLAAPGAETAGARSAAPRASEAALPRPMARSAAPRASEAALPRPMARSGLQDPGPGALLRLKPWREGVRAEPDFLVLAPGILTLRNEGRRRLRVYAGSSSPAPLMEELGPGAEASARLGETGLYRLFCVEAPELRAEVFVAGPFFSLPDPGGRYALELPPGAWAVTAWHPRLPPQRRELRLEAGEARLDFELSVEGLPEVPLQAPAEGGKP